MKSAMPMAMASMVECDSLSDFAAPNEMMQRLAAPPKPIVIRSEFPETWLFESFDLDSR
jgi:hypothetical protein